MQVEPNRKYEPTAQDWFWIATVAIGIIVVLIIGIK